jgi:DNA-binding transcriptional ArsR family regulator
MAKYPATALDATFAALSDPTRRAMLERLAHGECSVTELADPFPISLPAITKHLHVLKRAGLVEQGRRGRERPCRLAPTALRQAGAWIQAYRKFWDTRLEDFADYVEKGRDKR